MDSLLQIHMEIEGFHESSVQEVGASYQQWALQAISSASQLCERFAR